MILPPESVLSATGQQLVTIKYSLHVFDYILQVDLKW